MRIPRLVYISKSISELSIPLVDRKTSRERTRCKQFSSTDADRLTLSIVLPLLADGNKLLRGYAFFGEKGETVASSETAFGNRAESKIDRIELANGFVTAD